MDNNKIIAAIQMSSTESLDENLNAANTLIREAAHQHATLVVLPENFAIVTKDDAKRLRLKEDFGKGKIQDFLSNAARENNIWIVGGTIPINADDPNKIRAACLVYDNHGTCVARYDKIHLFDAAIERDGAYHESDIVEPGQEIVTVKTPLGNLGLAVCFDVRFPDLFQSLHREGAEIITLPSAFTVPTGEAHWEILNRARAIDTFSYFIGAAQGGLHESQRKTYGHSIIVNPWGKILAAKQDQSPGVIYAEIDLELVYKARSAIPIRLKSNSHDSAHVPLSLSQ